VDRASRTQKGKSRIDVQLELRSGRVVERGITPSISKVDRVGVMRQCFGDSLRMALESSCSQFGRALEQRGKATAADRFGEGLRHFHPRSERLCRHLESRRGAAQRLVVPRDHRPALLLDRRQQEDTSGRAYFRPLRPRSGEEGDKEKPTEERASRTRMGKSRIEVQLVLRAPCFDHCGCRECLC